MLLANSMVTTSSPHLQATLVKTLAAAPDTDTSSEDDDDGGSSGGAGVDADAGRRGSFGATTSFSNPARSTGQ